MWLQELEKATEEIEESASGLSRKVKHWYRNFQNSPWLSYYLATNVCREQIFV